MANIKITFPPKIHLSAGCRLFIFVFERVISRAKTTTARKNAIKAFEWVKSIAYTDYIIDILLLTIHTGAESV